MLIMNSRKVIFVHIQKCGGTSVEATLARQCKWNDVLLGSTLLGEMIQWQYFGAYGLHKHSSAKEIIHVVGLDVWSNYFTWATVRNPFSKIASLYSFVRSLVARHSDEINFPAGATSSEQLSWFAENDYPPGEPWSFPAVRAYLAGIGSVTPFSAFLREKSLENDGAFAPQWWALQTEEGTSLATNRVIRLEDLPEQWDSVCEQGGLNREPLLYMNETDRRFKQTPAELFSDPLDVRFVQERFEPDFAAFGYDPHLIP